MLVTPWQSPLAEAAIGELLGGSLDHAIANAVTKLPDTGALIEVAIGPVEALVSDYPEGSVLTLAVLPGTQLPSDLWGRPRRPPIRHVRAAS